MKILIADDEALSRRLLEKTLDRAGYEVIAVENGKQAMEQLCKPNGPRLALLDWIMPEMDGPAVCRAVRTRTEQPYAYMVLLTSKGSKEETVLGLESGADDYLTKPFNAEELRARLRVGERILLLEDRLVEARENMRFRATHDQLTSLLNRGAVMDLLLRELHRSHREQKSTAILLGDVDHFKRVNDTMGHVVGDEVLNRNCWPPPQVCALLRFRGPLRRGRVPCCPKQLQSIVCARPCGRDSQVHLDSSNADVEGPAYAHNELWCALELGMGTETRGGVVARGRYSALRSKSGWPELPSDGPAGSKVGNVTRNAATSRSAQTMMKSCVIDHIRRG